MKDKVAQFIGAGLIVAVTLGGIVGVVYAVTGAVSASVLRWWATAVTLALPVIVVSVWRLATNAAREHLSGFNRGLDGAERTISSVGRGLSATASLARSTRSVTPQPGHDDLLPHVGQMQIIDAPRGPGELIDL